MKFVFLILFPSLLFAQKKSIDKVEKYMDAQHNINKFSGTVLVMKNDTVLLKKAYGYADLEWKVNNTVDTKFVLASISKHFTAIAIMQLVESKQLSLDDKLNKFFPDYPQGEKVTIHMLLTHAAGLPEDMLELYLDSTIITKDSAIANIKNKPYLFNPGTNCKYSNVGYFLLSQIVEKVSNQTFEIFLKENIFYKANMSNSGVCNNDSIILKKAKVYYRNGTSYAHNPYINWNINTGLDGIYSTVDDLYKLQRAFHGEQLLSNLSKSIMTTQYNKIYPDIGFFASYSYGIIVNPYYNHNRFLLTHNGSFYGTMTTYDSYPEDNVFIAVLSNNESESNIISYGLAGIIFGKEVELPYKHKEVSASGFDLNRFVGIYENILGKKENINIISKDGKLYLNSIENELIPENNTKFFSKNNNDRTVEFIYNKKGKTKKLVYTKGGVQEIKNKIEN
jgi:CubicO group peptidase (beta-lactamase class C family)